MPAVTGGAPIQVPDEIVANCAFVDEAAPEIESTVSLTFPLFEHFVDKSEILPGDPYQLLPMDLDLTGDGTGFIAFFPPRVDRLDLLRAADTAAIGLGFRRVAFEDGRWPKAIYATTQEGGLVPAAFECEGKWWQCAVFPIQEQTFAEVGGEKLGAFIEELCVRLDAVLGRSFAEDGHGAPKMNETDGTLEYVDWLQYFGPQLVAQWGVERLRHAPFERVRVLANGAGSLWLGPDPYEQQGRLRLRRPIAEFLGIHLKPYRDAKGDPALTPG